MYWILALSVIANALLTLGVCWLLFRNGEVLQAAGQRLGNVSDQRAVTARQVQRWLNSNRERVAVVDADGTSPAVPIRECVFVTDHGALIIQTAPDGEC